MAITYSEMAEWSDWICNFTPYGVELSVWANVYEPGSGWGTPELLDSGLNQADGAYAPLVVVDVAGRATALWNKFLEANKTHLWASRYAPASGWEQPELVVIPSAGDCENYKGLTVDAVGRVTAIWDQEGTMRSNRYIPGSGWGTPVSIGERGWVNWFGLLPEVVVDPNGAVTAMWADQTNVWANRFE